MCSDGRTDISIFDVDDCLVITESKIKVHDQKTGEWIILTPAEFNEFERKDHHKMDFSDFNCIKLLKAGKIIKRVFSLFKRAVKSNKPVGIITAREDRNLIKKFLNHHDIFIPANLIFAVGGDNNPKYKGPVSERKKKAFATLISMGYRKFLFYDDDIKNLELAERLEKEFPIKMKTRHIDESWREAYKTKS